MVDAARADNEPTWKSWLAANEAKLPAVLIEHIQWVADHTNSFDEACIAEKPPTMTRLSGLLQKGRASSHAAGASTSNHRRPTLLPTKRPLTVAALQGMLDRPQDDGKDLDEDSIHWLCDCLKGYHPGATKLPLENWLFDSFLYSAEEIIPGLWLGGFAVAHNRSKLERMGITHVLCVGGKALAGGAEHYAPPFADSLEYLVVDVDDTEKAADAEALGTCFEKSTSYIDNALQMKKNGAVLVHCLAGVSRSSSVVCAYLISCHNMSMEEAIRMVRSARPCATPNPSFVFQLRKWESEGSARRKHATCSAV